MFEFLKKKFFFLIDKEEKEYIRQKVMNRDHKIVKVILGIIALFEIVVLVLSIITPDPNPALQVASLALYIILISVCIICIIALEIFKRKGKPFPYFVFVSIFAFIIMCWGVGMSLIVSYSSFSLLYYVLTIIAASALICLEPWIETLCVVLASTIYVVLYYTLPGIQRTDSLIFISGVLLAMLISLVCFYFNFYRRIKAISLELQITKLNAVLEDKANTDKLTGINNRLFLSERLENNVDDDFANGGAMLIDLDHFKNINDTYGHIAGDKCLSEMGRIIREITKDIDGFSVRYGGEEFLIYVKNTTKKSIIDLAESLRATVEKNRVMIKEFKSVKYTISIGVTLGKDKSSFGNMIDVSDKALYKAKETRNTVTFLD